MGRVRLDRATAAEGLPLLAAAAVPLLFLHTRYQPKLELGPATAYASDFVVALVVLAALASGVLFGFGRLRSAPVLWATGAGLVIVFALSCLYRPLEDTKTHLVTVAKYGEYALLAPSLVLLLRRGVDVERFLAVVVAWAGAAAGWGLLQFFGVVNEIGGKRPGQRELSFIDHESFGSFCGAALMLGLVALALGQRRRLAWPAAVVGGLGVILDGSISAYGGVVLGGLAVLALAWRARALSLRRGVALVAILALLGGGVEALRGPDIANYLSVVGVSKSSTRSSTGVQTGTQRELLSYIGLRIWEAHPWLGVGFDRSADRYQPFLAAAHRRFPADPPSVFPSKRNQLGVQDWWLQLLADTGIVGFGLGVLVYGAALGRALRAQARNRPLALLAVSWVLIAAGTWTAIGIVSGIPLDALTFLGFGLAVCAWTVDQPELAAATVPARSGGQARSGALSSMRP